MYVCIQKLEGSLCWCSLGDIYGFIFSEGMGAPSPTSLVLGLQIQARHTLSFFFFRWILGSNSDPCAYVTIYYWPSYPPTLLISFIM